MLALDKVLRVANSVKNRSSISLANPKISVSATIAGVQSRMSVKGSTDISSTEAALKTAERRSIKFSDRDTKDSIVAELSADDAGNFLRDCRSATYLAEVTHDCEQAEARQENPEKKVEE